MYNIYYNKIRRTKMDWEKVKSNINAGRPIIIIVYPQSGMGHSLTVCGYETANNCNMVKYWDSSGNNGMGCYSRMSYDDEYINSRGASCAWSSSVSYK